MLETQPLPAALPPGAVARAPRKNVMLAATISAGPDSAPVRIRNLSEVGAMIDGPALPDPGSTLTLNRLELSIGARVVWNRDGRCGLSLGRPIVVDDWIAGASSGLGARAAQFRVDQIQSAVRKGIALPSETRAADPAQPELPPVEQRIAAELTRAKAMLDKVSEELCDDVDVLVRHERAIQNFDIAAMIVEELAAVLAAEDREGAVQAVHMHDLKSRLSGRLTLT